MLSENIKKELYRLLVSEFETAVPLHMAAVSKFLSDRGVRKEDYGFAKMKSFLAELGFLSLAEETINGGLQVIITINKVPEYECGSETEFCSVSDSKKGLSDAARKELYDFIVSRFPTETPVNMGNISKKMTDNGYAKERYGYSKMKQLFYDLGFMSFSEEVMNGVVQTIVEIGPDFNTPPLNGSPGTETVKTEEITAPSVAPERSENISAGERTLSLENKSEIYNLLASEFTFEEPVHMAAVSKYMTDFGFTKERFGFGKMKTLLAELSEFVSMEEVPMNGVPQIISTLHSCGRYEASDKKAYDVKIPENFSEDVFMVGKTLAKWNLAVTGEERMPSKEEYAVFSLDYEAAKKDGTLRINGDSVIFPLHEKDIKGRDMYASVKRSDKDNGKEWYLNYAGTDVASNSASAPGKMLERFAFLGSWQSFLDELANKALPEQWDFEGTSGKFILKRYIQYTFYRLHLEDKICVSEDNTFAAFNTGLVTPHYDDIYACFDANGNDGKFGTQWHFTEFCTAAGRGLGKKLVECFNPLPEPASYFERKEDLLFDLEKPIHTDFEHIIFDNISRLPLSFLKDECYGVTDALDVVDAIEKSETWYEKKKNYTELSDMIAENSRLYNRIKNRIEDAIALAKKQVRWNFKTAIPSFFPTRNVMNLMLPLSLQDETSVDAALIVELTRSGSYQGQTVLSLQQAYIDSRLLCRPNSEWLNSENIKADESDDD